MGKLVKVCLVLVSILVVLAIVFVASIFYGLYKATSPPEEFKVLGWRSSMMVGIHRFS